MADTLAELFAPPAPVAATPAASTPAVAAPAPVESVVTTPIDSGTPAPEATVTPDVATDATPTTATPAPDAFDFGSALPALKARAKEVLGKDPAWLEKITDVDGLLKAFDGRETQVGQQAQYVALFNELKNRGVTNEKLTWLANAVQTGQFDKAAQAIQAPAAPASPSAASYEDLDKFSRGFDAQGNPIFDATAPANIKDIHAQWVANVRDAFKSPAAFKEFAKSQLAGDLQQVSQQTQQAIAAQQFRQNDQAAAQAIGAQYKNHLFTAAGEPTPFYQAVDQRIRAGVYNPQMPYSQQLQLAIADVAASAVPAPAAPVTPAAARRQPAPAIATPKTPTKEDFDKANTLPEYLKVAGYDIAAMAN